MGACWKCKQKHLHVNIAVFLLDMHKNRETSHLFYAPPNPKLTVTSSAALDMLQMDGQNDLNGLSAGLLIHLNTLQLILYISSRVEHLGDI